MRSKSKKRKLARRKTKLGLPDLDHAKATVLASLHSPESQRSYRHAIDEFVGWYCSCLVSRNSIGLCKIPRVSLSNQFARLETRFASASWPSRWKGIGSERVRRQHPHLRKVEGHHTNIRLSEY
jgi:hypothetical protein